MALEKYKQSLDSVTPLDAEFEAAFKLSEHPTEESLPEDLICIICSCILFNPVSCADEECRRIFCKSCILRWLQKDNNCPNCRREYVQTKITPKERNWLEREVLKGCPASPQCEMTNKSITYDKLKIHIQKECNYIRVPCPQC